MAFLVATQTISRMMMQKLDEFVSEIDNVHMVWLKEIEQEAYRMFSGESSTEPELMPKTPSQKRRPRKKRISLGLQEEARTRRRFSKGRRSNLAASSVKKLDLVFEEEMDPQPSTSSVEPPPPTSVGMVSREVADEEQPPQFTGKMEPVEQDIDMNEHSPCLVSTTLPKALVKISADDRRSAEAARPSQLVAIVEPQASPGRTATKVAIAGMPTRPRVSLTLRHSAAGLRGSQTLESVRRASRRSLLKKVKAHASNSTCSGSEDTSAEADDEDENQPEKQSEAAEVFAETGQPEQVPTAGSSRLHADEAVVQSQSPVSRTSTRSSKRKAEEHTESSQKKTSQRSTVVRPNMKAFFQTVHRNQMLMMTPNSLGRTGVMKSFIKHTTPLKVDTVAKERQKLEALKKKQEQEEERMKKMEEEKKKKQEELKRKRDERLRKTVESRAKEEQKKEEEKKKKMEQKRAQIEEKNDKLRVERLAEEKLKKQLALKHQEEIDSRRKLEEETRLRKIQQAEEEEKRQQALQAKRRAEEEAHRAHKLAEARRAQELKEQERAERERAEALQREVEKAAREKERKEAEKRKLLEDQRKKEEQQRLAEEQAAQRLAEEERAAKQRLAEAAAAKIQQPLGKSAGLNVTVDVESSIMKTPTGKDRPGLNVTVDVQKSDDYGMDQNSDDSTDDESAPRKPIPSWAEGHKLQQALLREYFNPPDLHALFGTIAPPNLEEIFYTKKPRFNKRTSSAVWHSPPGGK